MDTDRDRHRANDAAVGGDEPGVLHADEAPPAGAILQIGVRDHHRLRRHLDGAPHVAFGGVGEIDEHAEAVHLPHHVPAERRETAVDGRRGLDVAQLVHAKVDELEHALAALVRLLDTLVAPLEEVAAFGGHDRRALTSFSRRLQVGGRLDQGEPAAVDRGQQRCLGAPGMRVQLAGLRRARDVDVLARRIAEDGTVGRHREDARAHAPLPELLDVLIQGDG